MRVSVQTQCETSTQTELGTGIDLAPSAENWRWEEDENHSVQGLGAIIVTGPSGYPHRSGCPPRTVRVGLRTRILAYEGSAQ